MVDITNHQALDQLRSTQLLAVIQKLLDGSAAAKKKDLERHKKELQRNEFESESSTSSEDEEGSENNKDVKMKCEDQSDSEF